MASSHTKKPCYLRRLTGFVYSQHPTISIKSIRKNVTFAQCDKRYCHITLPLVWPKLQDYVKPCNCIASSLVIRIRDTRDRVSLLVLFSSQNLLASNSRTLLCLAWEESPSAGVSNKVHISSPLPSKYSLWYIHSLSWPNVLSILLSSLW